MGRPRTRFDIPCEIEELRIFVNKATRQLGIARNAFMRDPCPSTRLALSKARSTFYTSKAKLHRKLNVVPKKKVIKYPTRYAAVIVPDVGQPIITKMYKSFSSAAKHRNQIVQEQIQYGKLKPESPQAQILTTKASLD